MYTTLQLGNKASRPYRDLWFRCLTAIIAGHFIVFFGSKYGFLAIMWVSGYWPSLISSVIIAFCLVQLIYVVTVFLDRRIPYTSNWPKRIVFQFFFGYIGVAILAFGLAMSYFLINGELSRKDEYLRLDFPLIAAFIIIINFYYVGFYGIRVMIVLINQILELKKFNRKQKLNAASTVFRTNEEEFGITTTDIAYVFVKAKGDYHVVHLNGEKFAWFKTLKQTMEELQPDDFFMINKSFIIHRLIIADYKQASSRRYKLTLKEPFDRTSSFLELTVSQHYAKPFIAWYDGEKPSLLIEIKD